MTRKRMALGALALALTLTACGNNEPEQPVSQPVADGQEAAAAAPAAPPAVLLGNTELGNMLVGPDGRSLYGFTNDTQAASTCYGGCAEAWPPVLVTPDWTVGPGLDLGIFATTVRDDGRLQLVAGKWPLYYYAGDAAPGDLTGQGSGDVWFAVDTEGVLITEPAGGSPDDTQSDGTQPRDGTDTGQPENPTDEPGDEAADEAPPSATGNTVTSGNTELGSVLVDADGLTLYGFTKDTEGTPTCEGACAEAWPPLVVDGSDGQLPPGLDPSVFSLAPRADGTFQLVAGRWPLYRFAGDGGPGDTNGQGSGGVWFAVAPDGSLISPETAAPAIDDQPSSDESAAGGSGGDGGNDIYGE